MMPSGTNVEFCDAPTDKERAERIRNLVRDLHKEITAAKEVGLTVSTDLSTIHLPNWKGYLDAVKVSRTF